MMDTVQLSIHDAPYAAALRQLLEQNGLHQIRTVDSPDPAQEGVIVVDCGALNRLQLPLANPERVVLITRNEPRHLAQAWNAGIRSVVFCEDPLNTAVLAILAAELRVPKADTRVGAGHVSPGGVRLAETHGCRHRERKG
ncbi:MAG TPA: hypothetical protein VN428_05825 [Bryobacteraceae bacterium]|nr:hypothetical protein [Bryobacteraceae bacterium]